MNEKLNHGVVRGIEMAGCLCKCGGIYVWHEGKPTCNRCGTFVEGSADRCGIPLVGGWCHRVKGHGGGHACS